MGVRAGVEDEVHQGWAISPKTKGRPKICQAQSSDWEDHGSVRDAGGPRNCALSRLRAPLLCEGARCCRATKRARNPTAATRRPGPRLGSAQGYKTRPSRIRNDYDDESESELRPNAAAYLFDPPPGRRAQLSDPLCSTPTPGAGRPHALTSRELPAASPTSEARMSAHHRSGDRSGDRSRDGKADGSRTLFPVCERSSSDLLHVCSVVTPVHATAFAVTCTSLDDETTANRNLPLHGK